MKKISLLLVLAMMFTLFAGLTVSAADTALNPANTVVFSLAGETVSIDSLTENTVYDVAIVSPNYDISDVSAISVEFCTFPIVEDSLSINKAIDNGETDMFKCLTLTQGTYFTNNTATAGITYNTNLATLAANTKILTFKVTTPAANDKQFISCFPYAASTISHAKGTYANVMGNTNNKVKLSAFHNSSAKAAYGVRISTGSSGTYTVGEAFLYTTVTAGQTNKKITAVTAPSDVTIENGEAYTAPTSVAVTAEDLTSIDATFACADFDNTVAGDYTFSATLTAPTGYEFDTGVSNEVSYKVTVKEPAPAAVFTLNDDTLKSEGKYLGSASLDATVTNPADAVKYVLKFTKDGEEYLYDAEGAEGYEDFNSRRFDFTESGKYVATMYADSEVLGTKAFEVIGTYINVSFANAPRTYGRYIYVKPQESIDLTINSNLKAFKVGVVNYADYNSGAYKLTAPNVDDCTITDISSAVAVEMPKTADTYKIVVWGTDGKRVTSNVIANYVVVNEQTIKANTYLADLNAKWARVSKGVEFDIAHDIKYLPAYGEIAYSNRYTASGAAKTAKFTDEAGVDVDKLTIDVAGNYDIFSFISKGDYNYKTAAQHIVVADTNVYVNAAIDNYRADIANGVYQPWTKFYNISKDGETITFDDNIIGNTSTKKADAKFFAAFINYNADIDAAFAGLTPDWKSYGESQEIDCPAAKGTYILVVFVKNSDASASFDGYFTSKCKSTELVPTRYFVVKASK